MQNDDLEFINCANVLKAIGTDLTQPSRAQIAKYLGLSRTAVSMVVKKLMAAHLISELETEKSGRGRPGTPLVLDGTHWHAIGAAYSSKLWTFCVVNLNGEPLLPIKNTLKRPIRMKRSKRSFRDWGMLNQK